MYINLSILSTTYINTHTYICKIYFSALISAPSEGPIYRVYNIYKLNKPANTENQAKLQSYPAILNSGNIPHEISHTSLRLVLTCILSLEAMPLWTKYRLTPALGMCAIFHSGYFPHLISPKFTCILSLEAAPLGTKYRWISMGNSVISLDFLYWLVNFT